MRKETLDFAKDKYFNGYQNSRTVEENWQLIKKFLLKCIDTHVPSKISKSVQSLPWLTREIKTLVKRRNKTHANLKKTGNIRLKNKQKLLRKQVKTEVQEAHDNYVNTLIGEI